MIRFNKDVRDGFGNRVARHFDKYCEITNPVTFDVVNDIYRESFTVGEWRALCVLLNSEHGKKCMLRGTTFDLYMPAANPNQTHKYQRQHIAFGFGDGVDRPDLDIEYVELNPQAKKNISAWVEKAIVLKQLRVMLWRRCDKLLDWGWETARHRIECTTWRNGGWRGGPEPGQGCNTAGQVYRIWPELLPFLPVEYRAGVRTASVKSRLPDTILGFGTIDQFLCLEKSRNDDDELQTDAELAFERRKFNALTAILTQMSLMMDVPHNPSYPVIR